MHGFATDVLERADVGPGTVKDAAFFMVGGWLGSFAWRLSVTDVSDPWKMMLTLVILMVGFVTLALIEIAAAIGNVTSERRSNE